MQQLKSISPKRLLATLLSTPTTSYKPAKLVLKSGQNFKGKAYGGINSKSGEVVFTTSLVGYNESLTDPSYRGQILCFTQPLIGNYGVPSIKDTDENGLLKYFESGKIQPKGVIVGDLSLKVSFFHECRR
jgi:carbamoylphosphate synthase small subunit